ncbi:hypothetical protein AWC27_03425 [Mycobacterium szulgai]|uniref:Uncharacterized protein n=1 Tax=Mycobacterium szulgai TaxID=1787 RepID=A0A1X2EDF9_MYCSZ|nr:hypothetical protein AWC27_03425 [Mycobacterium szulgai]
MQGPGSPSAAGNFVAAVEQSVELISGCIAYLRANGFTPSKRCRVRSNNGSTTPRARRTDRAGAPHVQALVQRRQCPGKKDVWVIPATFPNAGVGATRSRPGGYSGFKLV